MIFPDRGKLTNLPGSSCISNRPAMPYGDNSIPAYTSSLLLFSAHSATFVRFGDFCAVGGFGGSVIGGVLLC